MKPKSLVYKNLKVLNINHAFIFVNEGTKKEESCEKGHF